jgi:heme exporter protein A
MAWGVVELACRRGEALVLEGVTFAVEPGEALILRGPNGSGKTTLLRTLAGLAPPAAGRVEASSEAFAYGGHADGLKGQLTVGENLAFWAAAFGTGAAGVARAVATFDLEALASRRAADLSAGQKRRAALARLLLTGRPVWLLDEPTVSLDAASVRRFARAVTAHLEAGGSAVIATHIDLGLAEARGIDVSALGAREAGDRASPMRDPFAEALE